MKSKLQIRIVCAAMLLCGAAIVVNSAAAQDTPPPPMPERSQGAPQGPGGPGGPGRGGMMDPDRRTQMMKDRLGLSDAQATQVKAVLVDERSKGQALMANQTGDRDAMRSQMQSIRKDSEDRISAILTPDQKAKWDTLRAEMQQRGRPGTPPPPPNPPPPPPSTPQL
jgi:Spy/CpxP family protein refolding chaperone